MDVKILSAILTAVTSFVTDVVTVINDNTDND